MILMVGGGAVRGQEGDAPFAPSPSTAAVDKAGDADTRVAEERSVEELIQGTIELLDEGAAIHQDQAATTRLQEVFDEATQNVQAIQEQDPTNPWLFYLRGRGYRLTGRASDAVFELKRFVETREGRNEWRAHQLLGDLFVENFHQLAEGYYKKAAALNANEPEVLLGLSKCASKSGEKGEAIRFAREAVDADGRRTPETVAHLARLLRDAERWDEAVREAESAVSLAKNEVAEKPGLRGPVRALDGRYELLLAILRKQIARAEPRDPRDFVRFARMSREKSEVTRLLSLHDTLRVVQLGIDDPEIDKVPALLEAYGTLLAEVGRTDDAIAAFEEALAADPGDAMAKEWLERLRSGSPGSHEPATP
jgi:tetratricopeptide (TPR) repeat protein